MHNPRIIGSLLITCIVCTGCEINEIEALKKAADAGDVSAMHSLGVCYYHGRGVPKNYPEAANWFFNASKEGCAKSQFNFGVMYAEGHGVRRDTSEAALWYRKSAEQGHAEAQHNLGICYHVGLGVPKDNILAYKWLVLAKGNGIDVTEILAILEEEMLSEEIDEAQRHAESWLSDFSSQ